MRKTVFYSLAISLVGAFLFLESSPAQAATTSVTASTLRQRAEVAWRGISSVNYSATLVSPPAGGVSQVKAWYGTWEKSPQRLALNAYVWNASTSTPVLQLVRDPSHMYATIGGRVNTSSLAYLQKYTVIVEPTSTLNPATYLGISVPVEEWWAAARIDLGIDSSPITALFARLGTRIWGTPVSDRLDDREVYRVPFTISPTTLREATAGTWIARTASRNSQSITGAIFLDKKSALPYRLTFEQVDPTLSATPYRLSFDISGYNTAAIPPLPSGILTMSEAQRLTSLATSTTR